MDTNGHTTLYEDYVSFETAKLLKEKGFDWEVHRSYLVNDNCFVPADVNDLPYRKDAIRIPTLQMVMKWLREVHKLDIDISIEYTPEKVYYYAILKKIAIRDFGCIHSETNFNSYEEACEAAIKYFLENWIQL